MRLFGQLVILYCKKNCKYRRVRWRLVMLCCTLWFSLSFSRRCLTFAPKSYPLLTTMMRILRRRFASFEPSYVSVNLITSMAVTGNVKAREISIRLEGFRRGRKRDFRTTFKFGNLGQLIILVNYLSLPEF